MNLFFRGQPTPLEPGDTVEYYSAGGDKVLIMLRRGTQQIMLQVEGCNNLNFSLLTTPERAAKLIYNLRPSLLTTTFERDGRASKPGKQVFRVVRVKDQD